RSRVSHDASGRLAIHERGGDRADAIPTGERWTGRAVTRAAERVSPSGSGLPIGICEWAVRAGIFFVRRVADGFGGHKRGRTDLTKTGIAAGAPGALLKYRARCVCRAEYGVSRGRRVCARATGNSRRVAYLCSF